MRTLIISGNLGKDPEQKNVSGTEMTTFSVATKGDKKDDAATWINVVLFGKTAEIAAQYLKKGSQVAITGQLQVRTYVNKEGVEKTVVECKGDRMEFLGGAPKADAGEAEETVEAPRKQRRARISEAADELPF